MIIFLYEKISAGKLCGKILNLIHTTYYKTGNGLDMLNASESSRYAICSEVSYWIGSL